MSHELVVWDWVPKKWVWMGIEWNGTGSDQRGRPDRGWDRRGRMCDPYTIPWDDTPPFPMLTSVNVYPVVCPVALPPGEMR